MHRIYFIIAIGLGLFSQFQTVVAAEKQLTLVYAAELPLIESKDYGSYANLATLLTQQRDLNNSAVFLFGGGSLAPSMLSSFDRGAHIIDILNSLEPDVMAVAKREFSFYEDELSLRAYEAAFPLVLTNATDPITGDTIDGIDRQVLFEKDGVKIGVLSVIDKSVVEEYLLQRLLITAPNQAIEESAAVLRSQGAELIVLIISNELPSAQMLLKQGTIDLVFRTDPHFDISKKTTEELPHNYIFLTAPGAAAVVTASWQGDGPKSLTTKKILLRDLPPSASFDELIQTYNGRISLLLNEEITQLATPMVTTRTAVRTAENGFGNIVSDALREASHTDVALINGGAIRGERHYATGHVLTREDISAELPFRSHIRVLRIKGKDILAALENGISQIEDIAGRFPHVSGMRFTADLNQSAGKRIQHLEIDGEPVEAQKVYTLATSDFLAGGGDGYESLRNAEVVAFSQQVTPLIADIVISVIRRYPTLSATKNSRIVLTHSRDASGNE